MAAECQSGSCPGLPGADGAGRSGNGNGNSNSNSNGDDPESPFTPPQSPWTGQLVRSENSAEIAQYHADLATRAAAEARFDAANATRAARAATRAARRAANIAAKLSARRPLGGGRRKACARTRRK